MEKGSTKVYIVEDMAISRAGLEAMLLKNKYEIAGSTAKAETAWKEIQGAAIDLVLLDINLAGSKNGIWLAQQIREYLHLPIVFLTAYGDQKTLKEVLEIKPEGYLMKPYQEPTLMTTLSIALTSFEEKQKNVSSSYAKDSQEEFVFIKKGRKKVKLKTATILFIKSEGNYLEIILEDHKTYLVRKKLLDFLDEFPSNQFFQCHRRYIVNSRKIEAIEKDVITIQNVTIPTSSRYRVRIEEALSSM